MYTECGTLLNILSGPPGPHPHPLFVWVDRCGLPHSVERFYQTYHPHNCEGSGCVYVRVGEDACMNCGFVGASDVSRRLSLQITPSEHINPFLGNNISSGEWGDTHSGSFHGEGDRTTCCAIAQVWVHSRTCWIPSKGVIRACVMI